MIEMIKRFFHRKSIYIPSPFGMTVLYILLGIWTLVCLFPLYWLLVTSLKLPIDVNTGPFYLPQIDFTPSLHAWDYVLVGDLSRDTIRPYINTIIVATTSAVIVLLLGTAAAYALTRFRYRPRLALILVPLGCLFLFVLAISLGVPPLIAGVVALVLLIILIPTVGRRFKRSLGNSDVAFWLISQRMLPPVAVVIPIYLTFQWVGLLDTRASLIITYVAVNLPIVVWLMRDYFLTIPIELEECAAIDGASRYRIFWSIVLPLAVPGLVATFLFVLVFTWNEYLLALFLSGADAQTMPLTVAAQNNTRGPQWWYMSVLILIMIIPVIAIAIVLERFTARGLLVGAVKG
jgi:multiple sugar transport system permease protein